MRQSSFITHLLDLFEPLGPVRARAMMGGHLIFCGDFAIALVADERLYLKVDQATLNDFHRAGGEPFVYEIHGRTVQMSFWTPPDHALDSPEAMHPWAMLALKAATRSKETSPKNPRPKAAGQKAKRGSGRRLH